jgi:signal transduction histidine kinase/ActR/RegA family two-component response regulator
VTGAIDVDGASRPRRGRRRSVARRVLLAVFAASTAVLVLATALELQVAYQHDVDGVEAALHSIEDSRLESLVEVLWVADEEQILAQLRGIDAMRDVEALSLDRTDAPPIRMGAAVSKRAVTREWPLDREHRGQRIELGTLRVTAGLDGAVDRVLTRLGLIVSTHGVGVVLVAALSLLLVHLLVLRHLNALAGQARRQAEGALEEPFTLERQNGAVGDELDDLAASLESLRQQLAARIEELGERGEELERDLEQRTVELGEARLEQRLQETQKLESLGLLAGGVAHDFNNLLVGILGNASLVLEDLGDRPDAQARVRQLVSAARRAAELTRQLLAYSGRGRFVITTVDLSALVRELTDLLRTSLPERASLQLQLGAVGPYIEGDATQIRQVVLNLITNAADALGDDGGTIRASVRVVEHDAESLGRAYGRSDLAAGRYVHLEVADTGRGMDEETRSRMFEPFFSTKDTGHGLGLAATLGIVRAHRGAVKVYSEPAQGTTVQVLLPEVEGEPSAPWAMASPLPPEPGRAATVLVVDDEEVVRSLARAVLERAGHAVLEAADGHRALRILAEDPARIDLVLLDLTMPGMSGTDCLRELRALRSDLPVLLSSGYNEQDTIARVAGRGLAGFLQKPYTASALISAVDQAIEQARARA